MSLRTCGAMKSHTACSLWPAARAWHTEDPMLSALQLTGRLDARHGQGGQIGLLSGADVELAALQGPGATDNWLALGRGDGLVGGQRDTGHQVVAGAARRQPPRRGRQQSGRQRRQFCQPSSRPSVAPPRYRLPDGAPGRRTGKRAHLMAAAMSPDIAPSWPAQLPQSCSPARREVEVAVAAAGGSGSGRRRYGALPVTWSQ